MFLQNLLVIFNQDLHIDNKLHSIIQMSYFYPRNAARLEFALSQEDCEMFIHSHVTSWLGSFTLFADSFNKRGLEFIAS